MKQDVSGAAEHELKCWPEAFQAVLDGVKVHEWRRYDRPFRTGDVLWWREWKPATQEYTGRELRRQITYISAEAFGIPSGWCVMSLRDSHAQGPQADLQSWTDAGDGIRIRWDEEAQVFVGEYRILSQGTTKEQAIAATKDAVKLFVQFSKDLPPLGKAERDRDLYKRQLDRVDEVLPEWKGTGRGRIETIEALKAAADARGVLEKLKELVSPARTKTLMHSLGFTTDDEYRVVKFVLDALSYEAESALSQPQAECADCLEAKRLAYSDATTPGFFKPYCSKHKPAEPQSAERQRRKRPPQPTAEGPKKADSDYKPGTDLARWIWCRFVGIPITEPYDKEFRLLLLKIASYTDEIKQRADFPAPADEAVRALREILELSVLKIGGLGTVGSLTRIGTIAERALRGGKE